MHQDTPTTIVKLQPADSSPQLEHGAFTLIELLVVISIIAILAALSFPAVQGALNASKKAQARNDVHQIAAAFKNYQLEYAKLPGGNNQDGPAPDNWASTLTTTNPDNPRGIVFFEPKLAKNKKGGLDGSTYYDPWGTPYKVTLDYDYDNKITTDSGTFFTTVVVESAGPDKNIQQKTDNISNVQ